MTIKIKRIPLIALLITVLLGGIWWLYFYKMPTFHKKELIHLLCVSAKENRQIQGAFLLTYYPAAAYLHIYRINENVSVLYQGKPHRFFEKGTPKQLQYLLENLLEIKIDGCLKINPQNTLKLLQQMGSTFIFNLRSEGMPKGEIVLDYNNYLQYVDNISDPLSIPDVMTSLWVNAVYNHFLFLKPFKKPTVMLHKHYALFDAIQIRKADFAYLFGQMIQSIDKLYFVKNSMNVEAQTIGQTTVMVPLNGGQYDRKKLQAIVQEFRQKVPSTKRFPIVVQIKNATSHKRLAAKTAGMLHLRLCSVKEYLNAEFPLTRSILLDRTGSALKRSYITKVTKTSNVYFSFDYKDTFDYTLYIGDDFYAIPLLNAQQ